MTVARRSQSVALVVISAISVVGVIMGLAIVALLAVTNDSQPVIIGEPNDKPQVIVVPEGRESSNTRVSYDTVHRTDTKPKAVDKD